MQRLGHHTQAGQDSPSLKDGVLRHEVDGDGRAAGDDDDVLSGRETDGGDRREDPVDAGRSWRIDAAPNDSILKERAVAFKSSNDFDGAGDKDVPESFGGGLVDGGDVGSLKGAFGEGQVDELLDGFGGMMASGSDSVDGVGAEPSRFDGGVADIESDGIGRHGALRLQVQAHN